MAPTLIKEELVNKWEDSTECMTFNGHFISFRKHRLKNILVLFTCRGHVMGKVKMLGTSRLNQIKS